jgi:hypothetical protein
MNWFANARNERKPAPFLNEIEQLSQQLFRRRRNAMTVAEVAVVESIANALLAEFETQALITRRFLERIPEDRLTWKPHEKSMTAGQLGYHIAFVPGGVIRIVKNSPVQAPDFANFPQPASRDEILKTFDESVALRCATFCRNSMTRRCTRRGNWSPAKRWSWRNRALHLFAT